MNGRWFVDTYRDAVWESETLNAHEKAIAETYARHAHDAAGNRSATAALSWVTYPRLMAKAGIGRRAKVAQTVQSLVDAGWLRPERQASRRATVYRLTIPDVGSSDGGTTETATDARGGSDGGTTTAGPDDAGSSTFSARGSDGGTTVVPLSAPGSSDGGTQPLLPQELKTPPPARETVAANVAVVVGEIVEEGEGGSIEKRIETLIDEAVAAKPHWRRRRAEIREQVDALLAMFDGDLDIAARVALETARAPDSGVPARITLAQNPALRRATTAHLFAKADALPDRGPARPAHPDAHPFQADDTGFACSVPGCWLPRENVRHKDAGGVPLKPADPRLEITAS